MNGYQLIKLGKNEVLEQIYDIEYSRTRLIKLAKVLPNISLLSPLLK